MDRSKWLFMVYWLSKRFSPPNFEDDNIKTAQARLINAMQIFFFVALTLGSIFLPVYIHPKNLASSYAIVVLMFICLWVGRAMLYRKLLRDASLLVSAVGWIFYVSISLTQGINDSPFAFAVMGAVIILGLLIDHWTGILFLAISALSGLCIAILQQSGMIPTQVDLFPPLVNWVLFVLSLCFLYGLMRLVLNDLYKAIARERQKNEALKAAESTLQASELRFRTLSENAFSGVYVIQNSCLHYVNLSMEQIFGYAPGEMLGLNVSALIHPADRASELAITRASLDKDSARLRHEIRGLRKNGEVVHIEILASSVELQGQLVIIGNVVDISERKRADLEMQMLKYSIDTAFDCAYWMDLSGRFLYVNDAACQSLGYTREELLELHVFDVNPRATHERWVGLVEQLKQEPNIVVQSVHRRKDGGEFPVEVSSVCFKFGDQEFINGFAKDITERKQAEARIQLSEKKYHDLFQVNKDGISIFMLDEKMRPGKFVEMNTAVYKMLGYSADQLLGQLPGVIEPDASEAQLQIRTAELERRGTVDFETVLRDIDGRPVYVDVTSQLIQYESLPAVMNILRDITERKHHEMELRVIATLSAALRMARSRVEMLPVIGEQILRLLRSDAITIEMIDPVTGDSIVEAAYGLWQPMLGYWQERGTGLNAIIGQTLRPYLTKNLDRGRDKPNPAWASAGIRGAAGVPLVAQEKLIGFIWIGHKKEISDTEFRLFAAIADIAANALHRSSLHEQALTAANNLTMAYETTLEAWARALELRDQETEEHSQRVREMTVELARAYGIGDGEMVHLRRGAILHDIGKIGIPDAILRKPGSLDTDEWVVMRAHPQIAYELLAPIEHLHPALDIPYCHHEKWDGSGYPRGLKHEQIPLAARLFAVVDVWDALRSDRPYRSMWSVEDTSAFIQSQSGHHFDPQIVALFLGLIGSMVIQ